MMRIGMLLTAVCLMAGCSKVWVRPGTSSESKPDEPEWSYSGPRGPAAWAESYPACGGPAQSPIDIQSPVHRNQPPLEFTYTGVDGIAYDSLNVVRVDTEGGTLKIGERLLTLREILIHVPGEHRIDGRSFDAEMQLLHVDPDTQLVGLSILMETGEDNDFIADVLEQVAGEREEVELEGLLPDRLDYFTYVGSTTAPPCTPDVRWYVLAEPMELSSEELDALKSLHEPNARPVQPLNGRRVVESG